MNRREAIQGMAILSLIAPAVWGKTSVNNSSKENKIIKPKRLKAGDTVAVIAPASGVSEQTFDQSLQNLSGLGFKTKVGRFARGGKGFLSGTDTERLRDLHWAFQDSEVDAVWCVRGGYGTSRLLPKVNYGLIKRNPKILVGFSDITALLLAVFQKTGLVTFHGPVGASKFTDYTKNHILNTLMRPRSGYEIKLPDVPEGENPDLYNAIILNGGKCRGQLIGGNLSLIAALNGTPYGLKDTNGKILFLEDVSEAPYRVDRMLTQMRQTIDMRSLAGIALGVFTRTENDLDSPSQSMIEVLRDRLGGLGIPVIYGLAFGHIRNQFTLPYGIRAELDTSDSTLTLLEPGVD
jgi:muramoyltetrapeptide carboxypeptidase